MSLISYGIFFKFLDSNSAPDDSISAISLMRRICDALVTLSQPVIIAEWIIFEGDEVVRIHNDTSWMFSCGHNLGKYQSYKHNLKLVHIHHCLFATRQLLEWIRVSRACARFQILSPPQ